MSISNIELTQDEQVVVTASYETWSFTRKTLDNWITIGKGIAVMRAKADRIGGRNAFTEVMEANGFGELTTGKMKWLPSLLLKIVTDPENLSRVQAWHNGLPLHQQLAWASPRSIIRQAKNPDGTLIFPKKSGAAPKPKPAPKVKVEHAIDAIHDYCADLAPDEKMQIVDRITRAAPDREAGVRSSGVAVRSEE